MIEYKGVRIPSSVDGWELYDVPSAGAALSALIEASKRAIDRIASARLGEFKEVQADAMRDLSRVMDEHADAGAVDSEPAYHARHIIVDAVRAVADIEVNPWTL